MTEPTAPQVETTAPEPAAPEAPLSRDAQIDAAIAAAGADETTDPAVAAPPDPEPAPEPTEQEGDAPAEPVAADADETTEPAAETAPEDARDKSWKALTDAEAKLVADKKAHSDQVKADKKALEDAGKLQDAVRAHDAAMRGQDVLGELKRRYGWTFEDLVRLANGEQRQAVAPEEPKEPQASKEVAELKARLDAKEQADRQASFRTQYRANLGEVMKGEQFELLRDRFPGGIDGVFEKAGEFARAGVMLQPDKLAERVLGEFKEQLQGLGVYDTIMAQAKGANRADGAQPSKADNGAKSGAPIPSSLTNGLSHSAPSLADMKDMTPEQRIEAAVQRHTAD